MKPGDYLFVQFGHNDMKDNATNALEIYQSDLKKVVAAPARPGGTPVLVTSMERKGGVEARHAGRLSATPCAPWPRRKSAR